MNVRFSKKWCFVGLTIFSSVTFANTKNLSMSAGYKMIKMEVGEETQKPTAFAFSLKYLKPYSNNLNWGLYLGADYVDKAKLATPPDGYAFFWDWAPMVQFLIPLSSSFKPYIEGRYSPYSQLMYGYSSGAFGYTTVSGFGLTVGVEKNMSGKIIFFEATLGKLQWQAQKQKRTFDTTSISLGLIHKL